MRRITRAGLALSATTALSLAAAMVPGAAEASSKVPTVTVTMTDKSVTLSGGTTLHAGRVHFKVVSPSGDHELQILKLVKRGYTATEAGKDVDAAFNGNIAAIKRIDSNIRWLGGADAPAGNPGQFAETLYAGKYYFIDQNSTARTLVTVVGSPPDRAWITNTSTISMHNYGFSTTSSIPRSGWTLLRDVADEPHFLVLQHVKSSTSASDVKKYIASKSQNPPSWALPEQTSSGVISPQTQTEFHYNLPAGKYLLACFWPDDQSGMPHFYMGMWKLVTLK
jgi:hypothetical protein